MIQVVRFIEGLKKEGYDISTPVVGRSVGKFSWGDTHNITCLTCVMWLGGTSLEVAVIRTKRGYKVETGVFPNDILHGEAISQSQAIHILKKALGL